MTELSLILLPVSNDILMSEKNTRSFSSTLPKKQHHDCQYQYPAYQYHQQQPQYHDRKYHDQKYRYESHETQNISPPPTENAETPQQSPRHSPFQLKLFEELIAYQRYWEAIHQRTVKQLQWIKDTEEGIYTSAQLKSMLCASFDTRLVPQ